MFSKGMLAAAAAAVGARSWLLAVESMILDSGSGAQGGRGAAGLISRRRICYLFARYHRWRQGLPACVSGGVGDQPEMEEWPKSPQVISWARLASSYLHFYWARLSMAHGATEAYLFFPHRSGRPDCRYGPGEFRLRKISAINLLMTTRTNGQGKEKPGRWNE